MSAAAAPPPPPPQLPGQASVTLRAHAGAVSAALFNARGAYVVTAGADRAVRLFSARAAPDAAAAGVAPAQLSTPIKSYAAPASHAPLALALSANDAQLAHGGGDRNVSLVDVASGAVLRRFNAHSGAVHALAFAGAADSLLLAAGFDARVRAYDLRAQNAWKPVMEMREGRDTILALAVRGAALWAAGKEGVVRGYDVRMGTLTEDVIGEPVVSLQANATSLLVSSSSRAASSHRLLSRADGTLQQRLLGHTLTAGAASRACFAAGDAAVVSGDEEVGMCAWDARSGDVLRRYAGGTCTFVDARPDALLSAHKDGVVRIWRDA